MNRMFPFMWGFVASTVAPTIHPWVRPMSLFRLITNRIRVYPVITHGKNG